MRSNRALMALGLALMWAFAAQADETLISGAIRVGAYDVEVQNASRTNWVNGELVITYLDTNSDVAKSFTLPQATTGRLLAVGGGGAGGQDQKQKYDANYGLPGGGGAGGLVIKDAQAFDATTYKVSVGAGGAAVARTLTTINKVNTWVPASYGTGANGGDSTVKQGTTAIVTAAGGGGGGRRSAGNAGGSGGGGSNNNGTSKNGGSGTSGQGYAGGKGEHKKFGAGGGGAGGAGGPTTAATVDGSGAGGPGKKCDITGEDLEYARGGAGGIPRVYSHYWDDNQGVRHYASISTDSSGKITSITYAVKGDQLGNNKYFWCEASDGKPGRDGYGDGGGGSGHYSSNPTFAGRGGNGAVIVRIPPYKTTVEDALKAAFADQPVMVSGSTVTLTGDVAGPIEIPDNLGAVTIRLDGHAIIGADGADGDDITPGGAGQPALKIVPHEYDCESGVTVLSVTGTGSLTGGNGGKGYPGGTGAAAVSADGFAVNVADGIGVTTGATGESFVQHPHKWAYTIRDNKIVAYCVADDGEPCSYRDQSRGPFVAVSAADAAYTAMRYDELTAVNGITPVTGIVVAPETYVGREGTVYPETSTPPREQGAYTVNMQLGDLRITSDFTITEPKPSQGSVYQAWKTAERRGRDVQICLSATFDGSKAINDGNVLFLGSRCSAHSMAGGTVESSVNAMTRYASVRWYAYGSSDPANNLRDMLTKKGEKVSSETVTLVGANHFVHKEMMDDLYAELVEKRNRADGYDLIILEFDGDLLCREGFAPYQLNYDLPSGWTDEKAARLRAAMSRYYAEDRVVWIVPDVNQEKSDAGYTGEYPWTSNPEFIWQRAFLNATETEGYRCPLQKNYEDADELVDYLQEVLVGHFFSNAIIKDKLAEGLTIRKVMPQMRSDGGIWRNFEGGPSHYTIPEPRSETTVKADVVSDDRNVEVTFDMKEEQAWACEHDQVIGDDFRVVIDAELDGFFSGVGEGGWQETNEGTATFTFTESNLDDDEDDFTITIEKDSPKIQNVKLTPDYTAEDVVRIYDGKGTNIVVKPIVPTPEEAIIRYSLDEHGTYVDDFALTNVCEKTKVWFEITDKNGEFTAATNFACVTILPLPPEPTQEESMGIEAFPAEKFYDAEPTNITYVVTNAAGVAIVPDTVSLREKGTDSWIPAAEFIPYVDTTNVTVEVKAEKSGFTAVTAEATVLVKPRPVTLVAGSDSKVYDGTPLTCDDFEVKDDDTTAAIPGYGFVAEEGVASVTMTDDSTITLSGSQPNVIASETAKDGTKLDRNYVVSTEKGTLTVTAATMGIEAFNVEKFYDAEPTNIMWVVTNATGGVISDAAIFLREQGTGPWIPAADFALYVDTTNATVQVRAEKDGFTPVEAEATVLVKPRPVTLVAGSASKTYDGTSLTCDGFTVKSDTTTEGYGFVNDEGVASVTMTPESTVIDPGSKPNVIATMVAKEGTKLERNYVVDTVDGTLTVTAAPMGIEAFDAEKFYDADPTNITWIVTNAQGVAITPDKVYLREQGGEWVEAADFAPYVDTTNVIVEVKAEKTGFTSVTAEATVVVKPRPVTLVAASDSKVYDGLPLTTNGFTVAADTETPGYGFVKDEGVASVTMTDDSTITQPGVTNNVIATEVAKPNTKLERNYVVSTEKGTLTVTAAAMGIEAFDAEKFYDAEPTNITWVVTNATGAVITDATISLREKGTDSWIPVADFTLYVDTTNVTVEVKAEKNGFNPVTAEATVLVKPRPVTLVAASDSKVYDGQPLTNWTFTVKEDTETPGYGFVKEEGVASVTMTPESTITLPGSQPNEIAFETAKDGTKLDRNYVVSTEPGTLTVTAATMGIAAFPVEKFYDAEPTNITWVVTNATGAAITDATISLREKGTGPWIPAADFARYVDTTNVVVEVRAEKTGFTSVTVEATVLVKPRPVTLVAASDSKVYDGQPLTNWTFTVKEDTETPGYGFVNDEGVASVTMTPESTITDPGSQPNEIASETAKDGTKLDRNYVVSTEPGTLTVTAATMGIEAFPAEKFYDAESTNVTWVVTNATGAAITDATISLREKGTGPWIPAADFAPYVDTTNVVVEVRAEKTGFTSVTAEATVVVKPRPVTLVAASDSKVYDGQPLTNWTFTVKEDTETPGYGFVKEEGVASVTMTPESTITLPGSQPNEIASETAKDGTKLDRNYVVSTEPGTLTVTAATMGIEAFPAEKFYDAEGTNITWVVTNAAGVAIVPDKVYLREQGGEWVEAADFIPYVDTTNVIVEVKAEKSGFDPVEAEATVVINPRPVTLVAASDSKTYDGLPLTTNGFAVATDTTTPGYGFVPGEGIASVTMTEASTITDPGSADNVIETTIAKENTKLERNYILSAEPGTLTVTAATMGITAFNAEKFYDADPTNITWAVTNAQGGAITDAAITLREQGTDEWLSAADFALYVDTTNVTVEVKAEKAGFTAVTAEATVLVKPRPVTLVAGSASKTYDGTPLTSDTFTVKDDDTTAAVPGYGFVGEEGVASVTMTPESTITLPGSQPNVIATMVAKPDTKLDRNYTVTTEPGTLTVTAATMGIEAFDAEKFYDAEATNITWVVTNATGAVIADATISLREKGTDDWIPVADFALYVDTTNATVQVRAEKDGFTPVEAEATVVVKPRPVTLVAASDSKVYDGQPLTNWTFTVKEDTETPGYGFVEEEGVASVTMTPESTITLPGSQPNEIASETAKDGTKLDRNYVVSTEPGTLTVTAATMGIAAFPVEKFYDAEPTNITWAVTNATGAVITDATISLREKGTDSWIPVADFTLYVDTTNVTVEVKAEKSGFTAVTAEAMVLVKPRPVTLIATSDSKVYDGLPLTNGTFTVKADTTTLGYGFVNDEGVASVTMTPESTITLPGSQPNVIASETAKSGTKLDRNYVVSTEPGTLTVTPAAFTASATPYDEFYDGQEHTIDVEVQKPEDAGEAMVTYSYEEGGTYLRIEDFEQLKDVTAGGPVTVYAKVEIEGYATVVVSATVNIKPRIVVEQAESASKIFDGTPLVQPNHHEDTDVEAEKSKAKWGTTEAPANSTGFVAGEGFVRVPMTAGSAITEPGVTDNVIDVAEVTLKANTKAGNYIFYYLPGELAVIQRQEEVRRDPEIVIPDESKEVIEESDRRIEETLNELVKSDPKAGEEPYIKYQLTVTPTNNLSEATRTTPEVAAEDAKKQIEVFKEEVPDAKIDKVEFVDVVLERTYDKTEAEETAKGNYNKDNWESLDKAEEHGNKLLEVTIPIEVPEGMELIGVTRSCDSKGTEILKPKDPNDPNAEGFVYDPGTKTVTLYAYDFCVFGFMMQEKALPPPIPPAPCHGICCSGSPDPEVSGCRAYDFKANVKLVDGKCTIVKNTVKGSSCVGNVTSYVMSCYRVKASRTIKGVFVDCDSCQVNAAAKGGHRAESLVIGEKAGGARFYVATSAKQYKYVYNASVYADGGETGYEPKGGYRFLLLNFIGGFSFAKSKVSEGLLSVNFVERDQFDECRNYSLLCAGFGACNGNLLKNLSGRLAGAVSASTRCGILTQCYEPCRATPYYSNRQANGVDTYNLLEWRNAQSPAFDAVIGTWSIKYNASKSKLPTLNKLLQMTFGSGVSLMTGAEPPVFPIEFVEFGD